MFSSHPSLNAFCPHVVDLEELPIPDLSGTHWVTPSTWYFRTAALGTGNSTVESQLFREPYFSPVMDCQHKIDKLFRMEAASWELFVRSTSVRFETVSVGRLMLNVLQIG